VLSLGAYEYALTWGGWGVYVFEAPREGSLFAQNREGLLGCVGFSALFALARAMCLLVQWRRASSTEGAWQALVWTCRVVLGLWAGVALMVSLGSLPSRRLVNATYVLWALAHSGTLLCAFGLAMVYSQQAVGVPALAESVNRSLYVWCVHGGEWLTITFRVRMQTTRVPRCKRHDRSSQWGL
jgi:hypothetical protein